MLQEKTAGRLAWDIDSTQVACELERLASQFREGELITV